MSRLRTKAINISNQATINVEEAKKEMELAKRKKMLESYNLTEEKMKEIEENRKKYLGSEDEKKNRKKLRNRILLQSLEMRKQHV